MEKYKVLIADDEYLICELIKKIIRWEELDLEFGGFAHNGQELLEKIQEEKPAIVITDISMPIMDGIDLIRQTRFLNIPCHFIIVSGYKQFEYAHNALKYGVDDYILKPINETELNQALANIVGELCQTPQTSDSSNDIQSPELIGRSYFLKRVISERWDPSLTPARIQSEYGITFREGMFRVLCIKLDFVNQDSDNPDHMDSINKKIISMFHDSMADLADQTLSCIEAHTICFAVNYPPATDHQFMACVTEFWNNAYHLLDIFSGLNITIGVGEAYPEIAGLSQSYQDAKQTLYYRILTGCGQILQHERTTSLPRMSKEEYKEYISQFKKDIESVSLESFQATLNRLFFLPKQLFPLYDVISIMQEVCQMLTRMNVTFEQGDLSLDYISNQIYYSIDSAISLPTLKSAIYEPVSYIFEHIHKAVQAQNTRPIRTVLKHLEEHYSDTIHLEDMAQLVSLNPAYLSNIFKKETGQNFVDYLNSIRIEHAKNELRDTNLSVNEIAYDVGFQDARYFSKIFKKTVGITPKDYRKLYS